jgi:glycosyltransferase involved in cell wall biosynthesis
VKLVIFIGSLARGGAERVTTNMANQLVDEGWQVTIVTLSDASTDSFELRPAVRRIALGLAAESANALEAVMSNLRRIRALRRVLQNNRPNAALGMMNTASALLAFASHGLDIVAIGSERGNPSTVRLGAAWSWLRRIAYRRLNAIVALTPEASSWLAQDTGARHIAVIPNAVVWPLPEQAPRVNPDSVGQPGRKRLMAVGRLSQVKGYDKLLEAFAQVAARHVDWELVIVGEGPHRSVLQGQLQGLGLAGRVILAGEAGNLVDWYQRADLFVLTSRHEGFPNVVLEAMAQGLACVSFDCEAGPRNIIRTGIDGLLVQDQDSAALAAALDQLMSDPDLRAQYAARATEVRERFASTRIVGMWRDLITEKVRLDDRINAGQGISPSV